MCEEKEEHVCLGIMVLKTTQEEREVLDAIDSLSAYAKLISLPAIVATASSLRTIPEWSRTSSQIWVLKSFHEPYGLLTDSQPETVVSDQWGRAFLFENIGLILGILLDRSFFFDREIYSPLHRKSQWSRSPRTHRGCFPLKGRAMTTCLLETHAW